MPGHARRRLDAEAARPEPKRQALIPVAELDPLNRGPARNRAQLDRDIRAPVETRREPAAIELRGKAIGGYPARLVFPPLRLARGRYRITTEVRATVNPGPLTLLVSPPFTIR